MSDNPNAAYQATSIVMSAQDVARDLAVQRQIEADRQAQLEAELANRTKTAQQGGYGAGGYGSGSY